MSAGRAFFDTTVLVYVRDRSDTRKQQIAERLFQQHLDTRTLFLSTQVLQEFYVTLSRKIQGVSPADAHSLTFELA